MASIFLSNAPYLLKERYGRLASIGATLPCLGLLMLGAALRREGHRVRIVDASAQGLSSEKILKEIKKFQPDIVGLTAVTPSILKTERLAYTIKDLCPSIPIVIGGPHVTAVPQKTLTDCHAFNYGVIGEGEQTLIELIEALSAGRIPSDVHGVVFRKNGKVCFAPPRSPITNLDTLPFPSWDLLDGFPFRYHPALFKYKRLPSTHLISARGCPNKCIFCDTSVFNGQIRFHSPEYMLEMVDFLVKNFSIKEIIFEDDQFLIDKERVATICEGFLKAKLSISWCCSGRVSSVNDLSLLKLMKRSGCWQISYGIESGNQKILDFAKKGIKIHQIKKAVCLTHQAGILSKGYFILGLPYETEKTIKSTIQFAKDIPLHDISVFALTPFPGSQIHDIADQYGRIDKDFEKMNLLNVVYVPRGLSKEKLAYYQRLFMKQFYLRPRIIGNYAGRLVVNPTNIPNMVKAFSGFLRHVFTSVPSGAQS